ncbi:succinyl-diaminopimelate desuccinylase, partial [Pseudorhodoplanes sp.]|uniref:succinyl-diaminopimelate desuccinylase n=1 Tax=Pseudorhodoplanes sp. TaxID=1934341 RepID=UPI003D0EF828
MDRTPLRNASRSANPKPPADPVAIAQGLLRCPSVTPAEGGALSYLEAILKSAGFTTHRMTFSQAGTPDVENFYARIGSGSPHLMFAGHTDVVPPGNEMAWTHPPFAGEIEGGVLYGRGAVDMKGGIAASIAAVLDHLAANGGKPQKNGSGSISFLITGDEESVAINGTPKLLDWAAKRGETFDHCILGEPSNRETLGDTIKIGRRGSQNGTLIVHGKQGHVAYPERADNPVTGLVTLIAALKAEPLDRGSKLFDPSNLEFVSIDIGNKTVNLIPAEARARFNIRFNDLHDQESLKALMEERAVRASAGKIRFSF